MGNSVIYRPAYDAEVEYLESTGTQYIDTGIVFNSPYTIELSFMLTKLNNYNSLIFGAWHDNDSTDRLQFYVANNNRFNNDGHSNITGLQPSVIPDTNTIYNITYTPTISQPDANSSMWLFARNNDRSMYLPYNRLRVYSCKIKDIDSDTVIRDYIPIRIGSVGYLYDKVTKQLFANKGTGNFVLGNDVSNAVIPQQRCVLYFGNQRSVGFERIYEEYEWLKGDGSAYINTKVSDLSTIESIYCYFIGNGIDTQRVFGRDNKGHSRFVTQQAYNQIRVYTDGDLSTDLVSPNNEEGYILIDYKNATAETKYSQGTIVKNTITTGPNLILFGNNWGTSVYNFFTGKIHKFEIKNILSFIPVKLLQPIPPYMDANNIARPAGECGMWDKVSNKFYGNVANSGTFTVKGPKCYEEYKWLNCYTADGATLPAQGADIGITPISLTNKVLTIELGQVSRNLAIKGNSPYFIPIWCSRWQAYNEDYMTLQERKGNNNTLNEITCLWTTSNTITLDFINNVATLGNSTFQIEGTGYTFRGFNNTMWQNPRTVGRIKISDELDLVPCKLTHGIPASMDANGIARPAGTCGMWDKVNDKFYGNVANSGTFTVSND